MNVDIALSFLQAVLTLAMSTKFDVYVNTFLDVEDIRTLSPLDIQMCVSECLVLQKCQSLNFVREKLQCSLLSTSHQAKSTKFSSGITYIYVNKDVVPCSSCEMYETCVTLSYGGHTCLKTECSTARPEVLHSVFTKEIDPPAIKFDCKPGRTMVGSKYSSTCTPGKPWTAVDVTCKEPIHGGWGGWGGFGVCSTWCGGGTKTRTLSCNSPSPQYGGSNCPGSSSEEITCNTQNCDECMSGWTKAVNNKCYVLVDTPFPWYSAQNDCAFRGQPAHAYIAESISSPEDNILMSMATVELWIGFVDLAHDGRYNYYSSSADLTYTNWDIYEPNGMGCAELANAKWNDRSCDKLNAYICQFNLH